jgi:hypothetical protein
MEIAGRMRRTPLIWAAAAVLLGLAAPALANAALAGVGAPAESSALKTMLDCRKLDTKDARADCYDAAVDNLNKAQTEGRVVVIDQEKLKTVRKQAFGFNLPSLSGLAKGLREDPINVVTLKVTEAHEESQDRWVIETAEQAVWRQTQSSGFPLTPHAGSALVVKPGFLGSFFCQIDKQAAFRCKRDR